MFFDAVHAALMAPEPADKCARVAALTIPPQLTCPVIMQMGDVTCGRPARPILVHPKAVPIRGLGSIEGRAALCHAVAHIEFNAINLALDALWRFGGMPLAYYQDWLSVAQDEARHFWMMRTRLQTLGYDYGSFTAHNGLWEAAQKTAHDPLVRMACVPRVLEARGLDVTPGMIDRLRQVGDQETIAILEVILQEEVGHVAVGSRWFAYLCDQRQLAPAPTFKALLAEQGMQLRPPFNAKARLAAGFADGEWLV